MRVSRLRLASLGLGWLVTLGVILAGTTLMHATGARAPVVPALPALTFGIGLCVAGALIATRYRHQLIGLVFGGPGILLISLALAQR